VTGRSGAPARTATAAHRTLSPGAGAAQVKSDWVGLIDEWAGRFFQELDYEREAASAATFAAQMADLPGITTPDVRPDLSSHTVLTTAWVPGAPGPARARVSGLLLGCCPCVRAAEARTPTAGACKEGWHSCGAPHGIVCVGLPLRMLNAALTAAVSSGAHASAWAALRARVVGEWWA